MKADWKKALLVAVAAMAIVMLLAGCKEKSHAQHQSQRSTTTQKQAEKALDEDL